MNILEEDYTYLQLQAELESLRYHREKTEKRIASVINHINAIKRDFKQYEEESNEETYSNHS